MHMTAAPRKPRFPERPPRATQRDRHRARLRRQFDLLRRTFPWFDGWIGHIQSDRAALVRFPIAVLLTLGGVFWFLPLLGIWMLPVGLMLMAIDIPALQGPVASQVVRWRRRIARWRKHWRR